MCGYKKFEVSQMGTPLSVGYQLIKFFKLIKRKVLNFIFLNLLVFKFFSKKFFKIPLVVGFDSSRTVGTRETFVPVHIISCTITRVCILLLLNIFLCNHYSIRIILFIHFSIKGNNF